MKALLILLLTFTTGCTMYSVERTAPDGSTIVVNVKSTRSFEQPDMSYTRTGEDATFDFKAAGADNNTDAIVGMFAPLIQGLATGTIKAQESPQ